MAYPSAITPIAHYIKENNLNVNFNLNGIMLGSETIYPFQRKILEDVFQTRVFSWYGMSEKVILASECENNNLYHVFPEYGITEIVDNNGEDVQPGQEGNLVGTGFINDAMPLIRYFTGDRASFSKEKCNCDRSYPLLTNVVGRSQDYIQTKDGSWIPLTALIFGQHLKSFSHINEMQIIQEQKGEIIISIVKNNTYSIRDEKEIRNTISSLLPGELTVQIQYTDKNKRTKRGKKKFLLQHLQSPYERFIS